MIGMATTIFLVNPATYPTSAFTNDKSILTDGVDEFLSCGHVSEIDNASAFSISLWMKDANTLDVQGLFTQYQLSTSQWIEINIQADAKVLCLINGTNGYGKTNTALSNNTWYHIVAVFDGTLTGNSNRLKIYINAVQDTLSFTGTIGATSSNFTTTPSFNIAQRFSGIDYFSGNIDEFAIFDYALSSGQVTSLYNSGTPTDLDNTGGVTAPIHWWRMGDGDTYPTITDVGTTGGNDGTMTNMESGDIVTDTP